jgi:hypothetical protein
MNKRVYIIKLLMYISIILSLLTLLVLVIKKWYSSWVSYQLNKDGTQLN